VPNTEPSWSPLDPAALEAAAGSAWSVTLLPTAGSTNAVATAHPVPGTVVVADHQTAGRGRLDRVWETPPGAALTFSAVVDPRLADDQWPLLPLATALAVADGVRRAADLDPRLKWPNDLLLAGEGADGVDEGKFAGILLERVPHPTDAGRAVAVIGVGINVGMSREQLPVPTATSLAIAGSKADRTAVFGAVVHALHVVLTSLAEDPASVLDRYRRACTTLGRQVEVHLPDGDVFTGHAEGVDGHGRLLVDGRALSAGDVIHVRPA
jgi:BirA family transcriptional regulator, biotin operon repressor / biotin---[acetyl-CoA-carboxylase] ligase